jgi:hypothetical protein
LRQNTMIYQFLLGGLKSGKNGKDEESIGPGKRKFPIVLR